MAPSTLQSSAPGTTAQLAATSSITLVCISNSDSQSAGGYRAAGVVLNSPSESRPMNTFSCTP
eukprot:15574129-Heterocapsa_arctica.AAC.1